MVLKLLVAGPHTWSKLALHSSLADLAAPVLQPLLLSDSSQLGYWVANHLVALQAALQSICQWEFVYVAKIVVHSSR